MAEQQQQQRERQQGTQPAQEAGRDLRGALTKLKDRAREALERQQAANRQELEELDRIRIRIEAENDQNWQEVTRRTTALKADAVQQFRSTREVVRERRARLKAELGERKDARDAKAAERRARAAEDYAAEVIAWALDGIDEAELAVIDAVQARADVERLQRGGAPLVH